MRSCNGQNIWRIIMDYTKIDLNSVEVTSKQTIFKADLLSEKETLEKRIAELNQMLDLLK